MWILQLWCEGEMKTFRLRYKKFFFSLYKDVFSFIRANKAYKCCYASQTKLKIHIAITCCLQWLVSYSDFSSILNEIYDGVSNLFHREWSYHWLQSCPFIFVASCFKHGSFYRKISLSCCQFYIRTDRSHGLGIFLSGLVLRRSLWKQNFLIWHTDENVIYC